MEEGELEKPILLTDEYSLFYLHWIKSSTLTRASTITPDYWISQHGSTKFASWAGFAFESVCRKHISQIIRSLNLEVVTSGITQVDQSKKGFQVDLIIDRTDYSMNLCEVKFCNSELIFSAEEAKKIIERRARVREATKTKKTLINTLISPYGAKKNPSYLEAFDKQLTMESLFTF